MGEPNFSRISATDLQKDYGQYIPDNPVRVDPASYLNFLASVRHTEFEEPSLKNKESYQKLIADLDELKNLIGEGYDQPSNAFDFIPRKYGDLFTQTKEGRNLLQKYQEFKNNPLVNVNTRLAGIGGGEYIDNPTDFAKLYPKVHKAVRSLDTNTPDLVGYEIKDIVDVEGNVKQVAIARDPGSVTGIDPYPKNMVSSNVLQMLEDQKNPLKGIYNIMFEVDGETERPENLTSDMQKKIMKYVQENAFNRLPPNSIIVNQPISNSRGAWYQRVGFGAPVVGNQYAYLDSERRIVPIQPQRQETFPNKFLTRSYGSFDPLSSAIFKGTPELLSSIKRTPASLLPGAADLIPSPEAVRTGYAQGPIAMGNQMARDFLQSLPTAAAAAGVLSTPLAAPLAPGIGAGLVGTAGARALNEVVRQETGEGIVPKIRQFIGTAPRTTATTQPRVGEQPLTAQIKPLTSTQRLEVQRQQNRDELQRRLDLVKERFNPRRGEFGISELLFGR